jgi:hypothetical protein
VAPQGKVFGKTKVPASLYPSPFYYLFGVVTLCLVVFARGDVDQRTLNLPGRMAVIYQHIDLFA